VKDIQTDRPTERHPDTLPQQKTVASRG